MIAGMTAVLLVVLAVVAIHVWQMRFRAQVERLHAEIVALQLHPGSFKDLQKLQDEWGEYGDHKGHCTEHHCIYEIAMNDGWRPWADVWSSFPASRWFYRLYPYLGGRISQATANIRVRDNRMWGPTLDSGLSKVQVQGETAGSFMRTRSS